jgi:hypothetical protein
MRGVIHQLPLYVLWRGQGQLSFLLKMRIEYIYYASTPQSPMRKEFTVQISIDKGCFLRSPIIPAFMISLCSSFLQKALKECRLQ